MGNFKKIERTQSIERRFINKIIVYLESEDDVLILRDRWFFDIGERVEFHTVDDEGSGGCTHVVRKVEQDREMGIRSYGIVDRDALLRENRLDTFFDTNDEAFDAAEPFGSRVTVLRRWELENYLLVDPEVVTEYLSDAKDGRPQATQRTVDQMLHCAGLLVPQIAANVALHQQQCRSLPRSFGRDITSATEMVTSVREHLGKQDVDASELGAIIESIERFVEDQPDGSASRWERQNRIVDGKLLMTRFFGVTHGLDGEHRFHLARKIRVKQRIDPEIRGHIERICKVC